MADQTDISKVARMTARAGGDGTAVFVFEGRLDAGGTARLWDRSLDALTKHAPRRLTVDGAAITYLDGAGAGLLVELCRRQHEAKREACVEGLDEDAARLFQLFVPDDFHEPFAEPPHASSLIETIGCRTLLIGQDLRELVAFVGEVLLAMVHAARHPTRVRWRDTMVTAELAGIDSLPIVVLIGFLIGLVSAFQSAVFMRDYGAEIYVANLVGLGMTRELGPLLTAIVLAGRSASSFAAELGTMKINEEINALETMGLEPVRFLVVPRVIAGVAVTPLLTLFATFAGIAGGAIVVMLMGYPLVAYTNQLLANTGAIDMSDFLGGMAKALVFGILVSAAGCLRGLQTRMGAESVGRSTTSAVVSSIILIALADSAFAVVYYYLDI